MNLETTSIKNLKTFCEQQHNKSGTILIGYAELFNEGNPTDIRITPESQVVVNFEFIGTTKADGYYLYGRWDAKISLNCLICLETLESNISDHDFKVKLISEEDNSLNYEEDCLETRFDRLELKPLLISEILINIPITPKHRLCDQDYDKN